MDAADCVLREDLGENAESFAVIGIVESGYQNDAIGDIEIGVAGGKPLFIKDYRRRHWQFDDFERLPVRTSSCLQPLQVLGKRQLVLVRCIWLSRGYDFVFGNKTGDVVNVAVRIVSGTAAVEPYDLIDAEII